MTRVELFELIRRDYELGEQSIRAIARKYGVHRRDVRLAISCSQPPMRRATRRAAPVLVPEVKVVIDGWLEADRRSPRKQRHTAHRIWIRLVNEFDFEGAESTVRRYVGRRRRELGVGREVFIEQAYQPGKDAQVDFGEAVVIIGGVEMKVHLLTVRCCFSGRSHSTAFRQQTQQCLLEGLVRSLEAFDGVFENLWFDNLKPAVVKVLRGRKRTETERFIAFRSHYLFAARFCRPGIEGAHEKGGVEGEIGRFRRNHLVPIPNVADLNELNVFLADACNSDLKRRRHGHQETIGDAWAVSACDLRPLPNEPFDTSQICWPHVDRKSRAQVRQNFYSVPTRLVGLQVEVVVDASEVTVRHQGRVVALHPRLFGTAEESLVLDHYLDWFLRKPGAMPGSKVIAQARRDAVIPDSYEKLWKVLNKQHGAAAGTREFAQVLTMWRDNDVAEVTMAVELSLAYGCSGCGAVQNLLRQLQRPTPLDCEPLVNLGELTTYERPAPSLSHYDKWLETEVD